MHNTDAKETPPAANVAISNESVAYHVAEDGLIDIVDDNDMSSISKNEMIHELYNWLADTGTTSHIMHR